jgi:hypothetical protein
VTVLYRDVRRLATIVGIGLAASTVLFALIRVI